MTEQEMEKQLAESFGFTCEPDKDRGPGWCKFKRGNVHVWMTRDMRWAAAIFCHDGFYRAHMYFDTLREALSGVRGEGSA